MKINKMILFIKRILLASLPLFFAATSNIEAQEAVVPADTTRKNAINLFLDCRGCDLDYMRREMPFINYVREVRESQVYLLITSQTTGSGGREQVLFFSGQNEFAGMSDTLKYVSSPDDTEDVIRTGLTNTIAAGLMRYVAKTPILGKVKISYEGEPQEEPENVADRWNYWVFEIETEPEFELEKSRKDYNWQNRISVDRITNEWKIENRISHEVEKSIFIRENEDDITGEITETRTEAVKQAWDFENLTVKSITDHWSVGIESEVLSSSYNNLDLKIKVLPSVEYNIFPYSQSSQKQLIIRYGAGFLHNNYSDTTVYNQVEENLWEQAIEIALEVQQKWGSANITLDASNYLHDFSKYGVEIDGFVRVRVFKGLSLEINGSVEFVHNQIELAKGDMSDEDIYLELRELQTNYRYSAGVGLVYTFGSIYNNIVNPRFSSGGGGFH